MNTESNVVEYKEKISKGFLGEVVSFLNYKNGGTIYIGIDDDGKAIDIEDVDSLQLKIKDKIKNNILPSTLGLFDILIEEKDNKKIIRIDITSGPEKPYYLKEQGMTPSGCLIRVGSSKEHMSEKLIQNLFIKRTRNSLKELQSPRQDLTFNQLKIYYEEHHLNLGNNFLKNLDLLTENGKYNYNAYLLADENTISIPIVKYYGNTKLELEENQDYGNRCLITATMRILDKLAIENKVYTKIGYYGREEQEMIDSSALKEAVINAIVHNDYSYGNTPIIELYTDRIEITSAGGLPLELSQEDFFEGIVYRRNKELIKVFKDVELIENIGSGVKRILNFYDKNCFKFFDNYLRVSFKYKFNKYEYKDDTINDTINDTIKITDNEKLVLEQIIKDSFITREKIVLATNLSDRTVSRALNSLQIKNVISREGSKKTGFWKINNGGK